MRARILILEIRSEPSSVQDKKSPRRDKQGLSQMKPSKRHWLACMGLGLWVSATTLSAQAQNYPQRPIKAIVPYLWPDGRFDLKARIVVASSAPAAGIRSRFIDAPRLRPPDYKPPPGAYTFLTVPSTPCARRTNFDSCACWWLRTTRSWSAC
jgi:hypothetical protein